VVPKNLSPRLLLLCALLSPAALQCASDGDAGEAPPARSKGKGGSAGAEGEAGSGGQSSPFPTGTSTSSFPPGTAGGPGEAGQGGEAGAGDAGQGGSQGGATCGDLVCNGSESCASCPGDCEACPASCGNGACEADETCQTCPGDCGACPPSCGDKACNGAETCQTCPGDCGACPPDPPACPDGKCNGAETCQSCPVDCGACPSEVCGDGVDNNGNGQVDEGCQTEITISPKPSDDCVCLQCPPEFPFVKSCDLAFKSGGNDPSSNSNCFEVRSQGTVYAMQGKACGTSSDFQGKVTGSIVCAKSPSGASCKVSGAIPCESWDAASLKDSYNNCN